MIPMTTIFRQTGLGYQTSKPDAKISHLLYMKNGYLKKETDGFIMAAQDQAIRINAIKARIDKTSSDIK